MAPVADITIKRGDTAPLEVQLLANGAPVPLTNSSIKFFMEPLVVGEGSSVVAGGVNITDAIEGKVEYPWNTVDVDTPGMHKAEFQVTFQDGTRETFPRDRYVYIEILQDLGD